MKGVKKTTEEFIAEAKEIHGGSYDYSLVEYKKSYAKVKIICPIHGIFEKKAGDHTALKAGCFQCGVIRRSNSQRLSTSQFIKKAKEIHGDRFCYSLVKYVDAQSKVEIICKAHGVFKQRPFHHLSACGCPKCNSSKGELRITDVLNSLALNYEHQKRFTDCKNIITLSFDFFIPSLKLLIEFDGGQHFFSVNGWGGDNTFNKVRKRDAIKNQYAKDNGLRLLRIKYTEIDKIEEIITKAI